MTQLPGNHDNMLNKGVEQGTPADVFLKYESRDKREIGLSCVMCVYMLGEKTPSWSSARESPVTHVAIMAQLPAAVKHRCTP